MKKMIRALSVSGLAAMAVALTPMVSALPSVASSAGETLQASRCTVMDVAAPGSPAADRIQVKQVVPLMCT
jgi:hypothetical protein